MIEWVESYTSSLLLCHVEIEYLGLVAAYAVDAGCAAEWSPPLEVRDINRTVNKNSSTKDHFTNLKMAEEQKKPVVEQEEEPLFDATLKKKKKKKAVAFDELSVLPLHILGPDWLWASSYQCFHLSPGILN